ncbi:hypothetical protein DPMN_011514 [Dreissena polymorpha]|uniref:Peptidase A2 domain-containing protein n=1 Tax=Dreissena polymorpha TaxID=45954 RepID=A0A9D4N0P9_DREPO|nr:hypothetical protein DPMN_011514 [Dreissena polymorpha]
MMTEKSVDYVKFRHIPSKQKPRPSAKSESASQQAASRHGRSRPSPQYAKSSRLHPQQERTCQNCTTVHRKGQCPAHGKQCHLCKKWNHFASACRSRNVNDINSADRSEDVQSDDVHSDDVLCDSVYVDSIESKVVDGQVFAEIGVGPKQQIIKFKIDTGSQVNILPFSHYQSIGTK